MVDVGPRSFSAQWSWLSWGTLFLVPFTLFWNGMLATLAVSATAGGAHPERLLVGLALPHVWVGVGFAYFTLASFVNSTRVSVEGGTLAVKHGPLPWRGTRAIPSSDLAQLFVVEKQQRRSFTYELCALARDGVRKSLLSGLRQDQARYLEMRCEQALGIVDAPVEGEVRS
jgi:hypothetical protein